MEFDKWGEFLKHFFTIVIIIAAILAGIIALSYMFPDEVESILSGVLK